MPRNDLSAQGTRHKRSLLPLTIKPVAFMLALWGSISMAHADIGLMTTIRDVYVDGQDELTGSITFFVNDNDFAAADDGPLYLRVNFDKRAALSRTLVDPTVDLPINLIAILDSEEPGNAALAMQPTDIQLIRVIKGERGLWIRINRASSNWIDSDGDGAGDAPPSQEHRVQFVLGTEAGIVNGSDTRIWVNFENGGCGQLEVEGLLKFDPIVFAANVPAGTAGLPENVGHESYDLASCTYQEEADSSLLDDAGVNFTQDLVIGRGVAVPTAGIEIFGVDMVQSGEPFALIGNLNGHVSDAKVHWNFGDEDKRSEDFGNRVDHIFNEPGNYEIKATITNGEGFNGTAVKTITVTSNGANSDKLVFVPHLTRQGGGFTTELIIENRTGKAQNYFIQTFNEEGVALTAFMFTVSAGNEAAQVSRLKADLMFDQDAAYCQVMGDVGVTVAYRATSAATSPAHVGTVASPAHRWSFYGGDWEHVWDGLAIVNPGDEAVNITFKQMDDRGNPIGQVVAQPLVAGAKMLQVIGPDSFDRRDDGFFVIEASGPIYAMSLRGTQAGAGPDLLWGNRLTPHDQ